MTRILIVEDSALVVDAFRVLFTDAGYEVIMAHTVAAAIERGTAGRVDVVLLDLSLGRAAADSERSARA